MGKSDTGKLIQSIYRQNKPYMMGVSFSRAIRGPPGSAEFPWFWLKFEETLSAFSINRTNPFHCKFSDVGGGNIQSNSQYNMILIQPIKLDTRVKTLGTGLVPHPDPGPLLTIPTIITVLSILFFVTTRGPPKKPNIYLKPGRGEQKTLFA